MSFRFWHSDAYGLIRRRSTPAALFYPEIWRDGRWQVGSSYVMDAITGMGEDAFSSGDYADELSESQARTAAAESGIDLFADNPDAPHSHR